MRKLCTTKAEAEDPSDEAWKVEVQATEALFLLTLIFKYININHHNIDGRSLLNVGTTEWTEVSLYSLHIRNNFTEL